LERQLHRLYFFALSGYVLTKNFHATGKIELIRSLAARRYTRLGIPIFASVMLAFSLYLLGAYQAEPVARITGSSWLASQSIGHPTFLQALRDGVYGVVFQGSTQFNTVFWTMRVEFIGSMLIFAYCLLGWPGRRSLYVTAVYVVSIFFFMPGSGRIIWLSSPEAILGNGSSMYRDGFCMAVALSRSTSRVLIHRACSLY